MSKCSVPVEVEVKLKERIHGVAYGAAVEDGGWDGGGIVNLNSFCYLFQTYFVHSCFEDWSDGGGGVKGGGEEGAGGQNPQLSRCLLSCEPSRSTCPLGCRGACH